jgi:diamine N-acetyltransferase
MSGSIFGLTRENAPTHPSFITADHLIDMKKRGLLLCGLWVAAGQAGFVALDPNDKTQFEIRNLAVLPVYRHQGYGKTLVRFGLDYAAAHGASRVSLSLIDENQVLKRWYTGQGFIAKELKRFPHLPFTVCYMEYDLSGYPRKEIRLPG